MSFESFPKPKSKNRAKTLETKSGEKVLSSKEIEQLEQRELVIDKLIEDLAKKEEMNSDDILSDIIVFAPYEQNESANPDYIEQVAEMIGITPKEMTRYAIKKAKDYLGR
jgi:hypothetical protein